MLSFKFDLGLKRLIMRLMRYGTIKMARVASIANKLPSSESCHPDVGLAKMVMGIRINITRSLFINKILPYLIVNVI